MSSPLQLVAEPFGRFRQRWTIDACSSNHAESNPPRSHAPYDAPNTPSDAHATDPLGWFVGSPPSRSTSGPAFWAVMNVASLAASPSHMSADEWLPAPETASLRTSPAAGAAFALSTPAQEIRLSLDPPPTHVRPFLSWDRQGPPALPSSTPAAVAKCHSHRRQQHVLTCGQNGLRSTSHLSSSSTTPSPKSHHQRSVRSSPIATTHRTPMDRP